MNNYKADIDCQACSKDSLDLFSRRYRYAFNVCTHCNPGLINKYPCVLCNEERKDKTHRHFKFNGNSCYICGPKIVLSRADSTTICLDTISQLDDIDAACNLLKNGEIVAIKTLFGFYLACDASSTAVKRLRQSTGNMRETLPLMARDLEVVANYCQINRIDRDLLIHTSRPVVTLNAYHHLSLNEVIGSNQGSLYFKLPNTPLLHLLMSRMNRPIVFLNAGINALATDEKIKQKLSSISNYFLLHNYPITQAQDDTFIEENNYKLTILKKGRGYLFFENYSLPSIVEDTNILALENYHTHIISCLMQNYQPSNKKVLAFVLDGVITNYQHNTLGCEFIIADSQSCQHVARFSRPINYSTNKQVWHALYAHILSSLGWAEYSMNFDELAITKFLHQQPLNDFNNQMDNSPSISSCLLLFEAVATAIGLCKEQNHLGSQAIYALEDIINRDTLENEHESLIYPFTTPNLHGVLLPYIEPITVWRAILGDLIVKTPASIIAARFHLGLSKVIVKMINKLCHQSNERIIDTIVLSSGMFENTVLLKLVSQTLKQQDFKILRPVDSTNKIHSKTDGAQCMN